MLLAPNGKESNLTPEQYKLVRTPAFKKWFGDWEKLANSKIKDGGIDESTLEVLGRDVSKVIDENGEPLVVYHGTTETKISIFNSVSYFTENYSYAKVYGLGLQYSTEMDDDEYDAIINSGKENVYRVFLNLRNPLIADRNLFSDNTEFSDKIKDAKNNEYDGMINTIPVTYIPFHKQNENQYLAFYPEQIKLADGSNTTFDANNPDIRFADGGEITSKQDDYVVYLKYIENGKEIGHLNYYINLEDVMSNYIDKKPYNFKNEVYIEIVEVDKENRGKGIAKKLLNRAISDAKDLNVDVITLRRDSGMGCNIDDPYDTYLKNIYSSLGFIDTWNEKDENESGGEKSACAMHLDLKNIRSQFKDGGDLKVNDMKSEITVSHIDKKYSNLSHKFINKQLMMGIEIEMEHTDNPEVAKKIALDHLNESPYYYQELEKMESRLQKKNVDSHFEDIKRMYDDGGTIDEIFSFKTPSGEKSKLTYIQQVLVRTSAFKNYFGDWEIAGKRYIKDGKENFEKHYKDVSKVIDWTTLEPRVVYHGTRAEQEFFNFDVTREKGVGRPYAYFAHNIEYAENFTRVSQRQDLNAKPFLYNCFLNVRNPFMAIGQEFVDKSRDSEGWLRAIVGNIVWDKYRTINRDDFTKALESTVQSQIGNYIEDVYSARKDKFWKLMARDIDKDFKFFLLAYDYDGIFYSEEFSAEYDVDNPSQFTYAITIFDARQVKLADGRNTKFDPLNSDIRYADGGATEPIINNTQNENDMNKLEQLNSIMKSGGAIYKNGGSVKGNGKYTHDAKDGGYFEGNSHANGGIKAINKDTGQIIEVEGNEVIINKRSVADTTKREFEGEMLTNREILSRINQSGGGVKFEDGGEMEHSTCGCSGKKYKYGGETLEDYVILHRISKSTSPKEDSQHLIKQVYG